MSRFFQCPGFSTSNQQTKSSSTNITYTSTGAMNAFGTSYTMTWNKADQLASATAFGTTNTYGYDAFGQRITSKAGTANALIHQYGQSMNLIETAGGSGVTVADYVYLDDMPLAQIKPSTSTIYALHTDSIDTPIRATDPTQAIVMTANFAPFGATTPTGTLTTALRRPGQFITDATPFYNNNARVFFPTVPRFLQPDLIGLEGGINTYAYALQSPYVWTDPSGLIAVCMPGDIGLECNNMTEIGGGGGGGAARGSMELPSVRDIFNRLVRASNPATQAENISGGQCNVASTPIGRLGEPIFVPRGTNTAGEVAGRNYIGHAFDQMQGRGIMPSAVEDAVKNGIRSSDPIPGRIRFYSPSNNLTVVTESNGTVVTVFPGKR